MRSLQIPRPRRFRDGGDGLMRMEFASVRGRAGAIDRRDSEHREQPTAAATGANDKTRRLANPRNAMRITLLFTVPGKQDKTSAPRSRLLMRYLTRLG
jgi:hypothetical protein